MQTPVLSTPRLTLRVHTLEDFSEMLAMWADPEVTRYIGGKPSTEEEVWARLMRYAGHWQLMGFGFWTIHESATGRFAGEAGFADFRRAIDPPLGDTPEAGWVLASWAHGKGFATEAVTAMCAWGDEHLPSKRTVCLIAKENAGSVRVAAKCGYKLAGERVYKGHTDFLFER